MLICVVGRQCSGKNEIIKYLMDCHNFEHLSLAPFTSLLSLSDHCTVRWQDNIIISGIDRYQDIDLLFKRPFFLLVSVDAPIHTRYKRWLSRFEGIESLSLNSSLESFVTADDSNYSTIYKFTQQAVILN